MGRRAIPREEKFETYVVRGDGCWTWRGTHTSVGYAKMAETVSGVRRHVGAHRVAYELFVGEIPDGKHLHHICENRGCVNPDHLKPVTIRENLLLSERTIAFRNRAKTHCPHGHEYTPENTGQKNGKWRRCRACDREDRRRRVALKRGVAEP